MLPWLLDGDVVGNRPQTTCTEYVQYVPVLYVPGIRLGIYTIRPELIAMQMRFVSTFDKL